MSAASPPPPPAKQAISLIERVVRGEAAPRVVESIAREGASAPPKASFASSPRYLLGYLRPNDRFVFTARAPFPSIRPRDEFVIVPAQRGQVSFTGRTESRTLELEKALLYPVELLSDPSTVSDRRFLLGDAVRHRVTGVEGRVQRVLGQGRYSVLFSSEGPSSPVDISEASLALVNKDDTTRSYISRSGEDWLVRCGPMESRHASQLDAAKALRDHRSAFNRWSKLMASSPDEELDLRVIKYLVRVDARIWRSERVLRSR